MGVLRRMWCVGRYSANIQKLEGCWDKLKKVAKCQSDSWVYCKWLTSFEGELCCGGLDFSPLKMC
jgi:hypothetical protein